MRLRATTIVASSLLVLACAHLRAGDVALVERVVLEEVAVVVRYDPVDGEVAAQLRDVVRVAVPIAQRWGPLPTSVTITVHPTHEALEVASRHPGHHWLRAWARVDSVEMQSPRTWSKGFATDAELTELVAHELTHCVMFVALGGDSSIARSVPVWFREGMATSNAGLRLAEVIRAAAGQARLASDAANYDGDPVTMYVTADKAFRRLTATYGEGRIRLLLSRMRSGKSFAEAFQEVMGISVATFERDFHG